MDRITELSIILSTAIFFNEGDRVVPEILNCPEAREASVCRKKYIELLEEMDNLCYNYKEDRQEEHTVVDKILEFEYGINYIPVGESLSA